MKQLGSPQRLGSIVCFLFWCSEKDPHTSFSSSTFRIIILDHKDFSRFFFFFIFFVFVIYTAPLLVRVSSCFHNRVPNMCLYITGSSNSTSVKHLIHNYRGKGNINLQILSQVALLFLSFLCVCVCVCVCVSCSIVSNSLRPHVP